MSAWRTWLAPGTFAVASVLLGTFVLPWVLGPLYRAAMPDGFATLCTPVPSMALVGGFAFSMSAGPGWGAFVGFLGGIFEDLMTGVRIGASAVVAALLAYGFGALARNISLDSPALGVWLSFMGGFGGIVCFELLRATVAWGTGSGITPWRLLVGASARVPLLVCGVAGGVLLTLAYPVAARSAKTYLAPPP